MIDKFEGEYHFLSNFYVAPITIGNKKYMTTEHAYQAAKTVDPDEAEAIRLAKSPNIAKKMGKKIQLKPNWEHVKIPIMKSLVEIKFRQHSELMEKLLATGDQELVEGNFWRDHFWGVCNGKGLNHLGRILMQLREKLRNEQ